MRTDDLTLGKALGQVFNWVSGGTISQMRLDKNDEVSIKNDGVKAFIDIKKRVEHHPIKLEKSNNPQSS